MALLAGVARELGDLVASITDDFTTIPAIAFMLVAIGARGHIASLSTSNANDAT